MNKDFREFIELLNAEDVHYLVVGGYAVALHGYPRYTKDIDIWFESNQKNAKSILKVLDLFGMGSLGLQEDDFQKVDQVVQIGYPPNRIDFLFSLSGLEFKDCYANRLTIDLDGCAVNFISLDDLKVNKKATGRAQDLADLENLEEIGD